MTRITIRKVMPGLLRLQVLGPDLERHIRNVDLPPGEIPDLGAGEKTDQGPLKTPAIPNL